MNKKGGLKMRKKLIAVLMAVAMVATLAVGCGGDKGKDTSKSNDGKITLKVFSNLPDRKNGQGLVEQKIIDDYMKENPNVTIKVEALDEEAYKTKFKAYAMEGMPDVVSIWGQPSFLDEVLEAGVLAELNQDDYADYGFIPGSMDGFMKDGKLYGLPRNTDINGFYYNKKMFDENGWKVPTTFDELLELAKEINKKDIVPVAMDGGEGWPLAVFMTGVLHKITGSDYSDIITKAISEGDFSDPAIKKAVELMKDATDAGLFQKGFESQDYATAQNLFTNGKAAMFFMGSWESSMALNEDIPQEIRENIRVFMMPQVKDGKAKDTDILAWNGGGYAVSANSEVKEEAIKFLNYMYQPDKLSKYGWENGVGMSAQDQTAYMTGDETELLKQFVDIVNNSTGVSGTTINDRGSSNFKTCIESEIQGACNGKTSVDDFLKKLGEACK